MSTDLVLDCLATKAQREEKGLSAACALLIADTERLDWRMGRAHPPHGGGAAWTASRITRLTDRAGYRPT
jgi:hypothetical protein